MSWKGQHKVELTLFSHLYGKLMITAIIAILLSLWNHNLEAWQHNLTLPFKLRSGTEPTLQLLLAISLHYQVFRSMAEDLFHKE